jgi:transcriptional regulator with XRE-family HTH domain
MGAGLSPEEVAAKIGVSRAALYNYEKGGAIKIETLDRVADLLGISLTSLLGVGVEYFSNSVSYFERMRQIEAHSDQVIVYFEPISYLLTSPEYAVHLKRMLVEGVPANFTGRRDALRQINALMKVLEERRERLPNIISIVGATQIRRFLRAGLIGTYDLLPPEHEQRRLLAYREVERIAALMDSEPFGVQIGIVEDTLPNQTFQIFRQREGTLVAVSPFRLGELPNIRLGVASITAAVEAVSLYQRVADELWKRAHKGPRAAAFLRNILKEIPRPGPLLRMADLKK